MVAAAVSMILACLAKETAIFSLPAALFMLYCSGRSESNAGIKPSAGWSLFGYLSFVIAAISYFSIRTMALSKGDVGVRHAAGQIAEKSLDYLYIVRTAGQGRRFYLKKIFYPWPLNFGITTVPDYYLVLGVILLFLLAYLLYRRDLISSFFVAAVCIGSSLLLLPSAECMDSHSRSAICTSPRHSWLSALLCLCPPG